MAYQDDIEFTCDFCCGSAEGEIFPGSTSRDYELVLPDGWIRNNASNEFCSEVCKARFALRKLGEEIESQKVRVKTAEREAARGEEP